MSNEDLMRTDADFMNLISNFLKRSLDHEKMLCEKCGVSKTTICRWNSGANLPHPKMRPHVIKIIKDHDCKCGKILDGRILFLHQFDEQNYCGVIVDKHNIRRIFTFEDINDYWGGSLSGYGYKIGTPVEFGLNSENRINIVRIKMARSRGTD